MSFIEQLEEEPLSEVVRYRTGAPKDAVAFSGTIRKHPYEDGKCILFAEPAGSDPAILEFRKADMAAVEELPSIVDETGHSRQVMKIWIRRGSLGIRYEPFEVDEPLRFPAGKRLHDHVMSGDRGGS
jgi:hypothetical protein